MTDCSHLYVSALTIMQYALQSILFSNIARLLLFSIVCRNSCINRHRSEIRVASFNFAKKHLINVELTDIIRSKRRLTVQK